VPGKRVEEDDWRFDSASLYAQYLACLDTLARTTEPDWPAFMKSEAWRAKTCQTVLAGWSQMRHTWVLQAKLSVNWVSKSKKAAGFIEPVPEFYREFGRLCERFREVLDRAGAFAEEDQKGVRDGSWQELLAMGVFFSEQMINTLENAGVAKRGVEAFKLLDERERKTLFEYEPEA